MRTTVEQVQRTLARVGTFATEDVLQAISDAEHIVAQYDLSLSGTCSAVEPFKLVDETADFIAQFVQGSRNEQQRITVTNATGGTFTLTFSGQTTPAIAYNASAADVQAALESLPAIGSGNVSVSGNNGGPWTVTFQGALGYQGVELLTASSNLTGNSPTIQVERAQAGQRGATVTNGVTGRKTYVISVEQTKLTLNDDIFSAPGEEYLIEDVPLVEMAERYKAAALLASRAAGTAAGISSAALGPMRITYGTNSQSEYQYWANEFEKEFLFIVGPSFA